MTEIQKQGRTRAEIETSALEYAKQAKQAAKKAVELAWHAGAEFNVLKERMPHGEWQSWLVKHRIPPSTARAWMQIARELPLKEAMKLGTVRASRKAISENANGSVLDDAEPNGAKRFVPAVQVQLRIDGLRKNRLEAMDGAAEYVEKLQTLGTELVGVKQTDGMDFEAFLDAVGMTAEVAEGLIELAETETEETLLTLDYRKLALDMAGV